MSAGASVQSILAGAKKTLDQSEQKFPSSQAPHDYSEAPYKMAAQAKKAADAKPAAKPAGVDKEIDDVKQGLRYRAEQAKALQE